MVDASPWTLRRKRAGELRDRWPFAAEVLAFYGALLEVQEDAAARASLDRPQPGDVAAYACARVMPRIIELSVASGPAAMSASILASFDRVELEEIVLRWLRTDETLSAVERYLARAATAPILETLEDAAAACAGAGDERHCPRCGGLPQLNAFAASREDLVTAHRYLQCSRCAATWAFSRMRCAACGETDTQKLVVYGEVGTAQVELSGEVVKGNAAVPKPSTPPPSAQFPHVRIDGCTTCKHYLLTVDLERDGKAVPLVDELAAIPLDLYAKERGLTKIVPNVMGF